MHVEVKNETFLFTTQPKQHTKQNKHQEFLFRFSVLGCAAYNALCSCKIERHRFSTSGFQFFRFYLAAR